MWKDSAFAHNVRRCSGTLKFPARTAFSELMQRQLPLDMGGANGKVAYIGTAYFPSSPDGT